MENGSALGGALQQLVNSNRSVNWGMAYFPTDAGCGVSAGASVDVGPDAGPAIAGAVIGGALLGGLVGNMLDQRDKRLQAEAAQRALETAPTGKPVAWDNPDSGHSGTVTVTQTFQQGGTYCREYQQTVTIGGKQENAYGTACRQPDGSWKIQS